MELGKQVHNSVVGPTDEVELFLHSLHVLSCDVSGVVDAMRDGEVTWDNLTNVYLSEMSHDLHEVISKSRCDLRVINYTINDVLEIVAHACAVGYAAGRCNDNGDELADRIVIMCGRIRRASAGVV